MSHRPEFEAAVALAVQGQYLLAMASLRMVSSGVILKVESLRSGRSACPCRGDGLPTVITRWRRFRSAIGHAIKRVCDSRREVDSPAPAWPVTSTTLKSHLLLTPVVPRDARGSQH